MSCAGPGARLLTASRNLRKRKLGLQSSQTAGRTGQLIGDPSGDGYDELAIGARWNDDAGEDAGAAYIFRGSGL